MTKMLSEISSLHLSHRCRLFQLLDWSLVGKVNPEICGWQPLAPAWMRETKQACGLHQLSALKWFEEIPPLGAIVHNYSKSLGFGPVELIPNRPYHSSVLGSAFRGSPANNACAGISPHRFIPIPAHTLLRIVIYEISSAAGWAAQGIEAFPSHSRAVTN